MDTPLPDDKGVLMDTYGNEQFSRDVIAAFPDLREELIFAVGMLHIQVGILAGSVRSTLDSGDVESAERACAFLDGILAQPKVIPEILNAIAISFVTLDELHATSAGRDLLQRMPGRIRAILLDQADRDQKRT